MRKQWKGTLAVMTALALAGTGCGGPGGATGKGEGGPPTANIATVLTMSGFAAVFGQQQKSGIDLAVEKLRTDKVADLKVVAAEDTGAANATALNAYRKAVAQEPAVVFGPILGTMVLAMRGEIDRNSIPLITTAATTSLTQNNNKNIFRNFANSSMTIKATAQFAFDKQGLKKPAILADNTSFGSDAALLRAEITKRGLKAVADESADTTATDVTGQVSRIIRSGADSVFLQLLTGSPLALAVKTLRSNGFTGQIYAAPGMTSPSTLDLLSESEAKDIYSAGLALDTTGGAGADFAAAFKQQYGKDPDIYAAVMYDSVMLLGKAVSEGKSTAADLRAALRDANYTGVSGVFHSDAEGNLVHTVSILKFGDGKKASVDQDIDVQTEATNG
ncbi:ABC transporter substrate-binding protein [Streptomyces sp. NPDC059460]|uniref:ABC transporter substrate-binding protein n=1 Tax=Streptomyces sp. NPDC059460 TaxID=3346840 RepID=UPI0036A1CFAE